jgi:hypothetical protein
LVVLAVAIVMAMLRGGSGGGVGVGGDVDIVAGITKLGEQVSENTKLE